MLVRAVRRLSDIRAPFPVKRTAGGAMKFERSMPMQVKLKAWERDGEDKESWFKRKHAHHHARQKRDAPRAQRGSGGPLREQKPLKAVLRSIGRDPLFDYVYGTNSVLAALEARKRELGKVYVHGEAAEVVAAARDLGIPVEKRTKMELNQLTHNAVHNGVVLECRRLEVPAVENLLWADREEISYKLPMNLGVSQRARSVGNFTQGEDRFPLVIYLDELSDPHNVGAILRTAYFLGVDMVLMSERNCSSLTPTVSKVSAGAMEYMDIGTVNKPLEFVEKSKLHGWSVVSADMPGTGRGAAAPLDMGDVREMLHKAPVVLILGSEGHGVRTSLLHRSDGIVSIGQHAAPLGVDSLNVSVATGIILGGILL